jgi:Ulp1 family protease
MNYQNLCKNRAENWLLCNGVLTYHQTNDICIKDVNIEPITSLADSNKTRWKELNIPLVSRVFNQSFMRVFSSTWFDSSIINSMFFYYNIVSKTKGIRKYFIADWAMHSIIRETEYKSITLKQFNDIFDAETLIMATNENQMHWMLMVVDIQIFTVTCYDSLGNGNITYGNKLLKHMEHEAIQRNMPEETVQGWKNGKYVLGAMGKQNNSYDCGPFTVMAAEFILSNIPLTELHQSDMKMYRYLIAWHILNGKIMYD